MIRTEAADQFCQSTELGFLKGNSLLKLGVISDFITQSQPRSALVFRWDAYRQLFIHLYQFRRCRIKV
ncbi:MAG: hypothetical protein EWV84_03400 [Microcystis sp. M_QC_C_20170808_M3Col]|nr:MAG: hypothetical protein EWV84_03400 [Microcystis sp. M_QC_C_20170808_M3Col]